MATEVKLPELGENLSGGDVLDVKVAAGDRVKEGQTLLEVEAEKSTVEVPSPLAGRIKQMLVQKGQSIQVGQTLCTIEEAGDGKVARPEPSKGVAGGKDAPSEDSGRATRTASIRESPAAETEPQP